MKAEHHLEDKVLLHDAVREVVAEAVAKHRHHPLPLDVVLKRVFAVEQPKELGNAEDREKRLGQQEVADRFVHRIQRVVQDLASPDEEGRQDARYPHDVLMLLFLGFERVSFAVGIDLDVVVVVAGICVAACVDFRRHLRFPGIGDPVSDDVDQVEPDLLLR